MNEHWAWSSSPITAGDSSREPVGRLPLLCTRPALSFPAKEITHLGRYQIILLGDRGTQV